MSGNRNRLTTRIQRIKGTRQLPYAALSVAATSMMGVWIATNKNASNPQLEEDGNSSSRNPKLSAASTAKRTERHTKTGRGSVSSVTGRDIATASLYQTINDNITRSSLNAAMDALTTTDPCSCERRTQQVPGGNESTYFHTGMPRPNSGRPKSVLTQDKNTALVRKHRTLRLLDKYKTQTSVDSKYSWNKDKMVGEGAYSKVYQATAKDTNEVVALKNISKKYTDSQYFQQEVEAMLYIQEKGGHPHVISLHEHFEDGDFFILILDFIRGGELFDHLIEMGAYSEMDASRIVREVASALLFLHGIGLVHADLKPEVSWLLCVFVFVFLAIGMEDC